METYVCYAIGTRGRWIGVVEKWGGYRWVLQMSTTGHTNKKLALQAAYLWARERQLRVGRSAMKIHRLRGLQKKEGVQC